MLNIDEEMILDFLTTNDSIDFQEKLEQLVYYFVMLYYQGQTQFADRYDYQIDEETFNLQLQDYSNYIILLLYDMRQRMNEYREKIKDLPRLEQADKLSRFVVVNFKRLNVTEFNNAFQMAEIDIINDMIKNDSTVKVYKTWVARPDACPVCKALNGTRKELNEPFLVSGQVVELDDGKTFEYGYIDRKVAIAHPNDRCRIEFDIER